MAEIAIDIPICTWPGISPALQASLEALERGEVPYDKEIERLERRAADGTLDDVRTLAVALVVVERLDDAAVVLHHVLERAPGDHPMRLNLVMVDMRLGRYEMARHEAEHVLAAATDPDDRDVAERLLEKITAGFAAQRDEHRLDRLRLEALRERAAHEEMTAAEWQALAVLLIRLRGQDPRGVPEAVDILERLTAADPDDATVAEDLASALFVAFDYVEGKDMIRLSERLDAVLRHLERVHPDSWVITALREARSPAVARADPADERLEWAGHVFRRAVGGGPDAAEALEELRALVEATPDEPNMRMFLMFAEAKAGHDAAALKHARWVSERPELPHEMHFNLAQVLWNLDPERGRHHLMEAARTARTEQDRQDVRDLLARLDGPS